MCGIAGLVAPELSAQAIRDTLQRMTDSLVHRGPDDEGFFVAPGIGLGYRRNLGPGSWLVRCADGKGSAWTKGFAIADDFEDASADGSVIDFWTAQTRAKELVRTAVGRRHEVEEHRDIGGTKPGSQTHHFAATDA